jgi:quinol monooxygenase YgiN
MKPLARPVGREEADMIVRTAQFRVKPGEAEACLDAIRDFVEAVAAEPGTLSYDAYRLEDGISFLHLMRFRDAEAEAFHRATPHVKALVELLYPRCEAPPTFETAALVASAEEARRMGEVFRGAGEGV